MSVLKSSASLLAFSLLLCAALVAAGCGRSHDHGHAHGAGHDAHGHVHVAPHGGVLVELGDHQFNLEFVFDPAAGRLAVYVLDAHAENFVRIAQPVLQLVAQLNGQPRPFVLNAQADPRTGETLGDTSHFAGTVTDLVGVEAFDVTVAAVSIRGHEFANIRARVHAPNQS
jgi:hypothetical protein